MENEFGRLAKGVGNRIKTGTETNEFIKNNKHHPPAHHRYVRETTYIKKTLSLTKLTTRSVFKGVLIYQSYKRRTKF